MGYEDSEYFFGLDKKSFAEAGAFCESEGGFLAELSSEREERTVSLLVAILRKNGMR